MVPETTVHDILRQVRSLSPSDRSQLIELLGQMENRPSSVPKTSAYGKMAQFPNSSEDFIRRKAAEIEWENRRDRS